MSKDPMTIRDYITRLEAINIHSQRVKTISGPPDAAGDPFTRLLTSSLTRIHRKTGPVASGLTAVDYLANPLQTTRCRLWGSVRWTPSNASSETISDPKYPTSGQRTSSAAASEDLPDGGESPEVVPPRCERIQTRFSQDASTGQTIENCIRESAEKYDLSPDLIRAVVKAESNFVVDAVSVAGAQGLMQLMPTTARELGVTDPFDIRQNIDGGSRYLRQMLDLFGGDIRKALSAYNAGPGNAMKYKGAVPFPETRRYVSRVLDNLAHSA